jgi:hypothetical protein
MWLRDGLSFVTPEKDLMRSASTSQSAASARMAILGQLDRRGSEGPNLIESVDDPEVDLLMACMPLG